jgi:TonB-dependent SusC/RagA subfamily outer membrane receptor
MGPNKPVPSWLSLSILVGLLLTAGRADENIRYRLIEEALNKFSIVYQQQKAYLHTDKPGYTGGDIIWIKAYLLNGMNHLPDTLSTSLYVELISPSLTRVEVKRFQMFNGFGIGDFKLSDTLPEGLYQLRAYTNWMKNFGEEFFFTKNFPLTNPVFMKMISPRQARVNQKELDNREKLAEDIDLQFMPEGGALVEGIESVVAFKAINRLGKGVDIRGVIVNDKGNTITSFASFFRGIGRLTLTPAAGEHYFAELKDGDHDIRVALPGAIKTGLVMHAEDEPGNVRITLHSSKPATADRTANEVILVGQIGGRIYYHDILTLEDGINHTVINKAFFPSGVIHLTAFSGRGLPLAERLIYNNRNDHMRISMSATDYLTEDGTKIQLTFNVRDQGNRPLMANLSLAVTREKTAELPVNNQNIVSYLLLSSDLTGFVEDPYVYFRDKALFSRQALDNLMLTQGWRRFDWEKILQGEYPQIRYHEEREIAIFGQITRDFFNIPLKNCKVQLSIMSTYNDVFTQYSTEKGFFLFDSLVYYDTVRVKIEAWRPNGRRNLLIMVPDEQLEEISGFQGDYSLITQSERDQKAYRVEKYAESKEEYEKEQERLEEESKDQIPGLYSEPDQVLRSSDFSKGSQNALDVIKGRMPGVNVYGDQVIIRGPNSIMGSNQPLFLIDGVPTEGVESIKAIPIEDIDRIEVLKGPSAAIYGARGANGVIAVYTKRGHFMKRGVIEFDMMGYSTPRIFYEPKYLPENEPQPNYTLYWLPIIVTDSSGQATLLIDKPQINGEYRFFVEGVSYAGHVGVMEEVMNNEE